MDVEAVLAQALAARGVEVERGTELIEVRDGVAAARAVLESRAGIEHTECDFVVDCDGLGSSGAALPASDGTAGRTARRSCSPTPNSMPTSPVASPTSAWRRGLLFAFALGGRATKACGFTGLVQAAG